MYETCIVMNIANRVDEPFILGLEKNFHQITRVERVDGSPNLIIHLKIKNDEEIKEFYDEIQAMLSLTH